MVELTLELGERTMGGVGLDPAELPAALLVIGRSEAKCKRPRDRSKFARR